MRPRKFAVAASLAALVMALGLVSCTSKSNDTTAQEPSTTTPTSDVAVSHVELGKSVGADKRVTEQATTFAPNETIYASVLTNGAAPNAEVKALWKFEDGQVVEETTQTIIPTGNDATEFHVAKPGGLPAGKYTVEIFVNGKPAATEEFQVTA